MPRPRDTTRSHAAVTDGDLRRLADLAAADRADLFRRRPVYAPLAGRLLAVCLAQGAALHRLDGTTGVKDFDVWSFFAADPALPPFPWRRMGRGWVQFDGRQVRVDLLGRSIPVADPGDPAGAVRGWLVTGRTESARRLAQKAVIDLAPPFRALWWGGAAAAAAPASPGGRPTGPTTSPTADG